MINQEIAKIFYEIAQYLEMDEVAFKPQAYEKAALNLETLSDDVEEIYKKGGVAALEKISGIGKALAKKIVEYIKTGKIKTLKKLKKKTPVNIEELTAVEGLGVKRIKILYKKLGIKNLKDLEKAANKNKISPLAGFGEKTENNILDGIKFLKRNKGRFLLGEILPNVYKIINELKKVKEVKKISEAGSVRRRKETIGDVDILIASHKPKKVINYFVSMPGVVRVWSKGPTKASVRLKKGFDADLRVLPEKQFGSALQYFTGSKEHNIVLRKIAINKGFKLNEYGLFKGKKMIAGKTEEEIYKKLGMSYIEPELRENQGEIELALSSPKGLPKLIKLNNIKGDFHCHSHWGAGKGKQGIENLVKTAFEIGYKYIGIADHTKFLAIEHGLNEKQLAQQRKYINKLNSRFQILNSRFSILQGCEANIMADGSIDIKDEVLAKLDFVIAGVHSQLKMPKEKMTERIIKAMRNPNVDIISHLTGRVIQHRDECEIDFDKILKVAKETGTILEINAYPVRLDLKDINIRKAKEMGVKMIINTDAHQSEQMYFMDYGVSQARRGWAEKKDIVNCLPVEKLLKMLK
ncbi:MAG: DNA polymerase/3'-5' exonuclease PolX [Candidatus Paceibacterota bacterium]